LIKDSYKAGEEFVAWKASNLWRYQSFFHDVTGFILSTKYITHTTISVVLAIIIACIKPVHVSYAMLLNPFPKNVGKATQIHSV
jgi:hypothetical protein